jgi:hypothetical protein
MVKDAVQVFPMYVINAKIDEDETPTLDHKTCHNCKERPSKWSVELWGWTMCDECLSDIVKFQPEFVSQKKVI